MLELNHISKTFNPGTVNEKKALSDLSLSLKPGDFATIIGSERSRKSPHCSMRSAGIFLRIQDRLSWMDRILPLCRSISVPKVSDGCIRIL